MSTILQQASKNTAWNGISFAVPQSWYPVVVLKNYLLFEEDYSPVFEIKWQQAKGRFSAVYILKRLSDLLPDTSVAPWKPPVEWSPLLQQYHSYGFTWKNARDKGNGLLLHHEQRQQVLLLRFHSLITTASPEHLNLLSSLKLNKESSFIPWILFDIQARLPEKAKLQSHEFLTGRYSLVFTLNTLRFSLLRFKPAAEMLQSGSLLDFGANLAGKCRPVPSAGPFVQQWSYRATGTGRVLDILRRKPTCIDMQFQHFPEHNTILGAKVQGNSPETGSLLEEICTHYHPV